jgi:MoaA/NifB/PqqE/SkfB family radical SAM enzyme
MMFYMTKQVSIKKELDQLSIPPKEQQVFLEKLSKIARIVKNQETQKSYLRSYQRIYQEGIDKDRRGSSIVIELTKRCPKNCPHCYSKSTGQYQDISDETLETILRYAKKHLKHVFLTGGEPTVDPRVFSLAEKNPDMLFFMFTNGCTMTAEYAKKLSTHGNLIPLLSIDGSSATTHDHLRGQGSYTEVMTAIHHLNTYGVSWGFISLVTEQNAKEVLDQKFINDNIKKGAFLVRYIEYLPVGSHPQPELILSGKTYYLLEKRKKEIVSSGSIYMQEISQEKCKGLLYVTVNGDLKNCFCFHYSKYNVSSCDIAESIKKSQNDWMSHCWKGECPIYADPIGLKNHLEKRGWKNLSSTPEVYLNDASLAQQLMRNYSEFLRLRALTGI